MNRTPALISFILNTLLLNLNSLHIGLASNHLIDSDYLCLIKELKCLLRIIFKTISDSEIVLKGLAKEYIKFDEFIFCGSGPNYGSALFNSSKIIETCGDNSYAVDIEEWAHSFYFSKKIKTH